MTRAEYLDNFFKAYDLVSVLSDKNECRVLRARNKAHQRDIIMRIFKTPVLAYEQLCRIECRNIPLIYDVINLEDGQIVLEEFIDGITVYEVMESERYRYIGAKKVLSGVCCALEVLHNNGIVHRDVKPENIMIDQNGRVVLIDFNASRIVSKANRDTVVMGTVGYASPEQLGISQSDARTDIYAVGVLLNVMITGKHPSEQIAGGKAGRIIKKCTSINPHNRYQTAKKLLDVL